MADAGALPFVGAQGVLVCDGAMGTMLHAAGTPLERSVSERNLADPLLVRDLHAAYLAAGARLVQTNTFDANRVRLAAHGLESRAAEINIAGARLAREAVRTSGVDARVAGSVGPVLNTGTATARMPAHRRIAALEEQIAVLSDWVDVILLETFADVASLVQAVVAARNTCDLPVIAQMTFGEDGRTLGGEPPSALVAAVREHGVAAVGANCTVAPDALLDVVTELATAADVPVFVQPNAGTPYRRDGRWHYSRNIDDFARATRRLVARGATAVGGCCGTTPAHVRAVAEAVAGLPVATRHPARTLSATPRTPAPDAPRRPTFLDRPRPIVVGLHAPAPGATARFVDAAVRLADAGARVFAVLDPGTSAARINPVAAAVLLRERVDAAVLLQVDTADRSLAALEADLLGAHALELDTVVCRTGTPRVAGDYPGSARPEVDSLRLVAAVAGLNDGLDWRGVAVGHRTQFMIGATVADSGDDRRATVERAAAKVAAGAQFLLTDAVQEVDRAVGLLEALHGHGLDVPVVASVAVRATSMRPGAPPPAADDLPGRAAKLLDRFDGLLVDADVDTATAVLAALRDRQ